MIRGKFYYLMLTLVLLTSCAKEELLDDELVLVGETLGVYVEPKQVSPLRYGTVAEIQLDNWNELSSYAQDAKWNNMQWSFWAKPKIETDTLIEQSLPLGNVFEMAFDSIYMSTGVLFFSNKQQGFDLVFPDNSYQFEEIRIKVTYKRPKDKPNAKSLKEIFTYTKIINEGDAYDLVTKDFLLSTKPMLRKKVGNPYRVEIKNKLSGDTTPFLMYAGQKDEINYLFTKCDQADNAIVTITAASLDEVNTLDEIQCVFDVTTSTMDLGLIISQSYVICTYNIEKPNTPVPNANNEILAKPAADGRGTRSSTSTAQTKPKLL